MLAFADTGTALVTAQAELMQTLGGEFAAWAQKVRRLLLPKQQHDAGPSALLHKDVSHAPVIVADGCSAAHLTGWHEPGVAQWQNQAYRALLDQMYRGDVRLDLQVASDAISACEINDPTILEVGCGSGYYCEVLNHLQNRTVAYTGLDYSKAMIDMAISQYPNARFVVGDATEMVFDDRSFDIVMNGAALMHMQDYQAAISESIRVSRGWCIFHTIPVMHRRQTTMIEKEAYGGRVAEITFNQRELEDIFNRSGLEVRRCYENIPHDYLNEIMGEAVRAVTYLCELRHIA